MVKTSISGIIALGLATVVSARKSLFIFGSSSSTTGYDYTSSAQPNLRNPLGNPPIGQVNGKSQPGTFTNGYGYVDFITTRLNKTILYSYDFAIAGAVTKNDKDYLGAGGVPSAEDQIKSHFNPKFKQQCPGNSAADTASAIECWDQDTSIFVTYIGNNDIKGAWDKKFTEDDFLPKVIAAQIDNANTLYSYGARNFLFITSPPLDRSPVFGGQDRVPELATYYHDYDVKLIAAMTDWKKGKQGVKLEVYHYWTFFDGLYKASKDTKCVDTAGDTCLWWSQSPFHVSKFVHEAMAKDMAKEGGVLEQISW